MRVASPPDPEEPWNDPPSRRPRAMPPAPVRLEACPGCGALFPPEAGATHPYIGASAGCWALYTATLAGEVPPAALLAASRVPPDSAPAHAGDQPDRGLGALLIDAYAAQHHGVPGPQAVQSVAVHLLALHGVLGRGVALSDALWIRLRAVRRRGVFEWLAPPPRTPATLTPRHLFAGAHGPAVAVDAYVAGTYAAWAGAHDAQLARWYDAWVLPDRLPAP